MSSSQLTQAQLERIAHNKAEAERKRKLSQEKEKEKEKGAPSASQQTSLMSFFNKAKATTTTTTTPSKAPVQQQQVAMASSSGVSSAPPDRREASPSPPTLLVPAQQGSTTGKRKTRTLDSDDDDDDDDVMRATPADAAGHPSIEMFECTDDVTVPAWLSPVPQPRKRLTFGQGAQYDDNEDETIVRNIHDNTKKPDWLARRLDAQRRAPGTDGYDETTLYIPQAEFAKLSDMMKQYWRYKSQHMNEILWVQWGTFFEALWDDADVVVRELGIVYTNRPNMNLLSAGVPLSGWEKHVQTLVKRGYVVTMLAQGDKVEGEKVVDRNVSLKASLGTLNDESWLPDTSAGFVMALKELPVAAAAADAAAAAAAADGVRIGVCLVDTTTNECRVGSFDDDAMRCRLDALLMQTNVRELLLEKHAVSARTRAVARQHVNARLVHTNVAFASAVEAEALLDLQFGADAAQRPPHVRTLDAAALSALGTMLQFLRTAGTGKLDEQVLKAQDMRALIETGREFLFVDGASLRNLCVLPPPDEPTATEGTLLGFVDRCQSAFGRRMLLHWISHPLRLVPAIEARLDAVEELMSADAADAVAALRALLARLPDLERRVAALANGRLRAGEFVALIDSLESVVGRLGGDAAAASFRAPLLRAGAAQCVAALGGVVARAKTLFDRAQAGKGADAKVVPLRGADAEFDTCTDALDALKAALEAHLVESREALGSRALQYWHPKGKLLNTYQIEVPTKVTVPGNWEKKSGKAGTDRYHSPFIVSKLPELERLTIEHDALVSSALSRVQRACVLDLSALRGGIRALAELDVLQAFARAVGDARISGPMTRPRFEDEAARGGALLQCRALRHPCLSDAASAAPVPNDMCLDAAPGSQQPPFAILSGANMGGKSTQLRQACLAVILAQCGCFVPALECRLTPVDSIMTRIGAHDRIGAGQSTFMVELLETSAALRCATSSSLVILDELGRGTSTHDGLAIAYAVIDELTRRRCRALFATHYHLLNATYAGRPRQVALWHMRVKIEQSADGTVGRIVPLYELAVGAALKSFGAECALMSGVPQPVVDRAAAIAREADKIGRDQLVVDTVHALAALLDRDDADDAALEQVRAQVLHMLQTETE